MTDGRLQTRVAAWEREQLWAPSNADASLRHNELHAQKARSAAIMARAAGDEEEAARLDAQEAWHAKVAQVMRLTVEARAAWEAETAVTRDLAERASEELRARGVEPGHESGRISAEEWLEHQREVDARDEAEREVTEMDVPCGMEWTGHHDRP